MGPQKKKRKEKKHSHISIGPNNSCCGTESEWKLEGVEEGGSKKKSMVLELFDQINYFCKQSFPRNWTNLLPLKLGGIRIFKKNSQKIQKPIHHLLSEFLSPLFHQCTITFFFSPLPSPTPLRTANKLRIKMGFIVRSQRSCRRSSQHDLTKVFTFPSLLSSLSLSHSKTIMVLLTPKMNSSVVRIVLFCEAA